MGKLYIDMTHIVNYAMQHNRCTGVQRVALRALRDMYEKRGEEVVGGIFWHSFRNRMYEVDLSILFSSNGKDDVGYILKNLGMSYRGFREYINGSEYIQRKQGFMRYYHVFRHFFFKYLAAKRRARELSLDDKALVLPTIESSDRILFTGVDALSDRHLQVLQCLKENGLKVGFIFYDMIPKVRPDLVTKTVAFERYLHTVFSYTDFVLPISESANQDFARFTPSSIPATVVPLAHEFATNSDAIDGSKFEDLKQEFVLCVGTIEVRKNSKRLLNVWLQLVEMYGDQIPQLVFAGRKGWKVEGFEGQIAAIARAGGSVIHIDRPSDEQLSELYRRAKFTVFASVYEGWGLPVGESLWCGTPCLASSATSVPEVGGDLCDYFDPTDEADIYQQLESYLIVNPKRVEELRGEISARRESFRTWKDYADMLHQASMSF